MLTSLTVRAWIPWNLWWCWWCSAENGWSITEFVDVVCAVHCCTSWIRLSSVNSSGSSTQPWVAQYSLRWYGIWTEFICICQFCPGKLGLEGGWWQWHRLMSFWDIMWAAGGPEMVAAGSWYATGKVSRNTSWGWVWVSPWDRTLKTSSAWGMMVVVLKHVRMVALLRELLKLSVVSHPPAGLHIWWVLC